MSDHYDEVCTHGYKYGGCACPVLKYQTPTVIRVECPDDDKHRALKKMEDKIRELEHAKRLIGMAASDVDRVMQEATKLQNQMNAVFLTGVKEYVEELRKRETGEMLDFGHFMMNRLTSGLWGKVL